MSGVYTTSTTSGDARPHQNGRALTTAFTYDEGTKAFTVTFSKSQYANGDTVISIPDYQYHGSISVQSSDPDGRWSYIFDPAGGLLHVTVDPGQQVHTISVVPYGGLLPR